MIRTLGSVCGFGIVQCLGLGLGLRLGDDGF